MSLFDMFNAAPAPVATPVATPAAPTPLGSPTVPGNLPPASGLPAAETTGTAANGVVPAEVITPVAEPVSPMVEFEKLWEPVAKSGEPSAQPQKLDPAKLKEIVSKATLTNAVTPEMLTAVTAGGEGAQEAFMSALNSVGQTVLMQATLASNKITEQAVEAAILKQQAEIPNLIRTQSAAAQLRTENPLFSNPAITPVIQAVEQQLAAKNPEATPQELTAMAKNFVTTMAESFAPAPAPATTAVGGATPQDWEAYFK